MISVRVFEQEAQLLLSDCKQAAMVCLGLRTTQQRRQVNEYT